MNLTRSLLQPVRTAAAHSRVIGIVRSLIRESWVVGVARALFRPTSVFPGGRRPMEADHESAEALHQVMTVVADSTPGRVICRVMVAGTRAWEDSALAQVWGGIVDLAPVERVRVVGGILLVASVMAGVTKFMLEGPWPPISFLLWICAVGVALILTVGARHVLAAWSHHRR
jgi:hypothetical protein